MGAAWGYLRDCVKGSNNTPEELHEAVLSQRKDYSGDGLPLVGSGGLQLNASSGSLQRAPSESPEPELKEVQVTVHSSPDTPRDTSCMDAAAPAVLSDKQYVFVVRHGHRMDEIEGWAETADRPYDPPLTDEGREAAAERGRYFLTLPEEQRPRYVVTSPFLRCIETARCILDELTADGSKVGLYTSWAISEVHNPAVLKVDHSPVFTPESGPTLPPLLDETPQPAYPESMEEAMQRYQRAVREVPESAVLNRGNVVLVTHGHAVAQAVASLKPDVEVYATDFCSCVPIRRDADGQRHIAASTGDNGVHWLDAM
eukprot:TRINITY_DN9231_c0_g3_i1.p1 TRINITY_DN9231_c0_g3~~TRINITY_DN9231_c0_g3_i1.p1  ORF type:complete len:314 (+),score=59.51 TRINITY_DN9231_c0_g3_i1:109-1050(+)